MSGREQLPSVGEDANARHTFDLAMRGYDKRQVDQHLTAVDGELAGLAAERDRAVAEISRLSAMAQSLQAELVELRERPVQIDRASFKDLGPMVEQMLTLAEKQAGTIIGAATHRASSREAESERLLNEARDRAAQMAGDLEAQLSLRRADIEQFHESRRAAAETELAQAREQADKVRTEAQVVRADAEQEAQRIAEQNGQHVERARAEAEAVLTAARRQGEQELAQQRAELTQEIEGRRTEAAQRIAGLHAQAQQQADDLRRRMDEQAAAHQQQLAVLQEEILAQRKTMGDLQTQVDSADQQLAEYARQKATMDKDFAQLQQRLNEVNQAVAAEHVRLDEARRAGVAAEQHAKDVRAKVKQEAKRVAELAAAAVLAAAADVTDNTGEFPQVVPTQNGDRPVRPHPAEPPAQRAPLPGGPPPERGNGLPAQRAPQPASLPD